YNTCNLYYLKIRKRVFLLVTMGVCIVMLQSGCAAMAMAPFSPPQGMLFNSTAAPLDVDYSNTTLGTKQGTSNAYNILGLFAFGDASTQTAAKNGQINTIHHADYSYTNILGIFQKTTVIVYGE
ncbi:MAG: TRL-like family protein, partial [Deltaproteobacteria bacterium]|nr:TRL-like family protein [Deltaproteobacteria bacterium]